MRKYFIPKSSPKSIKKTIGGRMRKTPKRKTRKLRSKK